VLIVKNILRNALPLVGAAALAVGAVVGTGLVVGQIRHSQDVAWCRKVVPTLMTVRGAQVPVPPEELAQARAGCAAQRRTQRGLLGAVWRTGGKEMANCGVTWARYQQLSDTDASKAAAVIAPYGFSSPLEASSRSDQQDFINACLAAKRTH
jgi:hypothetical protein